MPRIASGAGRGPHTRGVTPFFRSALSRFKALSYDSLVTPLAVLAAVVVFWIVGALGGLAFLHRPQSPFVTLAVLYGTLFLMVCSVVAGAAAVTDLTRRLRRT